MIAVVPVVTRPARQLDTNKPPSLADLGTSQVTRFSSGGSNHPGHDSPNVWPPFDGTVNSLANLNLERAIQVLWAFFVVDHVATTFFAPSLPSLSIPLHLTSPTIVARTEDSGLSILGAELRVS